MSDPAKYRSKDEVQKMRSESDPIEQVRKRLMDNGWASEDDLASSVAMSEGKFSSDWVIGRGGSSSAFEPGAPPVCSFSLSSACSLASAPEYSTISVSASWITGVITQAADSRIATWIAKDAAIPGLTARHTL